MRRFGTPDVMARWHGDVLSLDEINRRQFMHTRSILELFGRAQIETVVLKGPPLSQRIYGAPFVRHSADIDLFVGVRSRADSHAVLRAAGWKHISGTAPGEGIYRLSNAEGSFSLEIHSRLADDPLLAPLRFPPPQRGIVDIEGSAVQSHSGPLLPAYLATHLAKHTSAPLLWSLDFLHLWDGLSENERREAHRAARWAGAERYLEWCVRRLSGIRAKNVGRQLAAAKIGGASRCYSEQHATLLAMRLASSRWTAAVLLFEWLKRRLGSLGDPKLGDTPRGRLRWLDGVAREFRRLRRKRNAEPTSALARRVVPLSPAHAFSLLRDALSHHNGVWLVVRGGSMTPAIPSGAEVRIGAARHDCLAPGDVVLVETSPAEPILHRIQAIRDATIFLRGDSVDHADRPLALSRVIGVATHVKIGGRIQEVTCRPRSSLRGAIGRLHRRVANRRERRGA